eukprot:13827423-Alexandrium_andersonii.AAC.1
MPASVPLGYVVGLTCDRLGASSAKVARTLETSARMSRFTTHRGCFAPLRSNHLDTSAPVSPNGGPPLGTASPFGGATEAFR